MSTSLRCTFVLKKSVVLILLEVVVAQGKNQFGNLVRTFNLMMHVFISRNNESVLLLGHSILRLKQKLESFTPSAVLKKRNTPNCSILLPPSSYV